MTVKKILALIFLVAIVGLIATNPNSSDFKKYAEQGMGYQNFEKYELKAINKDFLRVTNPEKIFSRANFLLFSIYEVSPDLIVKLAELSGGPTKFNYDYPNSKIKFVGVAGQYLPVGNSERVVSTTYALIFMCSTGAIECSGLIREFGN